MESVYDNSSEQDTDTVTKENEEAEAKRKRNFWWKEENWPSLKKLLERLSNPTVYRVCDEGDLELCEDNFPKMTLANFLKRIGSKQIT